jgi:ferredoxin-thioredoxin reductase catalytic subunit
LNTLEKVRQRAEKDAERNSYFLNPDQDFLQDLLEGLEQNEERYGYPSCPCRLASGKIEFDRDIICPCDYRDPDVEEFGTCYCALYVNQDVYDGKTTIIPVPERRPLEKQERIYSTLKTNKEPLMTPKKTSTGLRLWYCRQCGYVCYREEPPHICPICKAKKEMFTEIPS